MEATMAAMTATEAKNKFGQALEMSRSEPLHIQKNGRDVAIILSPEEFRRLLAAKEAPRVRPAVEALLARSIKRHDALYKALAK
jgi:prevent-host-death family protein